MAALLDFGKHRGRELGSVPTTYLKWMVGELQEAKFAGWKVLAQQALFERLKKEEGGGGDSAADNDVMLVAPSLDPSKTVIPFGKYKGKEIDQVPPSYLKWMATEICEGRQALWGLAARKLLDDRTKKDAGGGQNAAIWDLLEARRTSVDDILSESGLKDTLDSTTYASLLRQCIKSKALSRGKQVHAHLIERGYDRDTFLGNLLVQMYGNCGSLEDARMAFDSIREQNVYSWNMIVAAYAQNGHLEEARDMFDKMLDKDVVSWTTMITGYAQNGHLEKARAIFDEMPEKNVVSWTAMIAGYAQNGHLVEARSLFDQMRRPNPVSWNTMIAAYARAGDLQEAKNMLDKMTHPTVASWNIIVMAYAEKGQLEEARSLFDKMPDRDIVSWNSIISAYAQNGHLQDAKALFDSMTIRNAVSWNALIGAYTQSNLGKEALDLYRRTSLQGIRSDAVTLVHALNACSTFTGLSEAKGIHASIADSSFISEVEVGTALVHVYGTCGALEDSKSIFDSMPQRNTVTFNSMIAAYAKNAKGSEALKLFHEMNLQGMLPSDISFISVLSACSHQGLSEDGQQYFVSIARDHYLELLVEHYVCMIDLLGRSGKLEEAEELINNMPFEPSAIAWMTLLSACKLHSNTKRGTRAAIQAIRLNPENSAPYLMLCNIFAAVGNREAVRRVRKTMKERGVGGI